VIEDELDYLRERALDELRAAITAFDVRVRCVHLQMVDAYAVKLRELSQMGATEESNEQ
jgi:hypothetical protein